MNTPHHASPHFLSRRPSHRSEDTRATLATKAASSQLEPSNRLVDRRLLHPPLTSSTSSFVSFRAKPYPQQVGKHALAGRVVDARNPGRKLTRADQTMNLDAEYSRYEVSAATENYNSVYTIDSPVDIFFRYRWWLLLVVVVVVMVVVTATVARRLFCCCDGGPKY